MRCLAVFILPAGRNLDLLNRPVLKLAEAIVK